ncbi:MAG TPA: FAD-binding protein, partial [Acidimicrobiales bacterium]|nr:FAD-binding protein [Acidimicrobiales bacterium]
MSGEGAIDAAARLLGERARRGVPLGPLTTYRVGGPAALLVEARSEEDLALLRKAVAGTRLPVLARQTASLGLAGLEWGVGVPGSVGGAVRMNAGGHGSDVSERLTRFSFVDLAGGEDGEFGPDRLEYGYRHSTVAPHHVVTWAEFGLEPGDPDASAAEIA